MKIAYIYDSLSRRGGTEHILIQKMNELVRVSGIEVYAITCQQNGEQDAFPLSDKVKHIDIEVQLWKRYLYSYPKRLCVYHQLKRQYKKTLIQALHTINPDILVCCHTFLPDVICSLPIPAKKIIEAHNPRGLVPFPRKWATRIIEKNIWFWELSKGIKKCDALVSLTQGDAKNWIHAKRVEVIPNMVEPFSPSPYPLDSKSVVALGRFTFQKAFDQLIEAWKHVANRHPDWTLTIYGEGDDKQKLQNLIDVSGLEGKVNLLPFTHQVEEVLKNCSFLVCSSIFEGFGLTLVEAMTVGRPCVSYDCPYGPAEIIEHEKDGLLVPPNNIQVLAASICRMIEQPGLRMQMAENAFTSAKRYHPNEILARWQAFFTDISH